jgi:hypothetical protein
VVGVQLAGHDMLKGLGIDLIPASAPDFFTEDTPTAVLVRQVLGAIAQFEKASWKGLHLANRTTPSSGSSNVSPAVLAMSPIMQG